MKKNKSVLMPAKFNIFVLTPGQYSRNKSYYNKAHIYTYKHYIFLISYTTPVLMYNKRTHKYYRFWDDWSVTTGKHIDDFTRLITDNPNGISKSEFLKIPLYDLRKFTARYNIYIPYGIFSNFRYDYKVSYYYYY